MSFAMNMDDNSNDAAAGMGFYNPSANDGSNPFDAPVSYGGNAGIEQPQAYNTPFGAQGFQQQQQQQQFMQPSDPLGGGSGSGSAYSGAAVGSMGSMDSFGGGGSSSFGSTDAYDEPPLLEELGIDFLQIQQKTLSVLNPMRNTEPTFMAEADLAGPVVFCVLFGATMLASGRIEFGYIYGVSILGTLGMYLLLNLMSDHDITFAQVASILGYCLLPMVGLSALGILFTLSNQVGGLTALVSIAWCSLSSSKMFTVGLNMHGQQGLIAYPCMLLYGVFAMLTVF